MIVHRITCNRAISLTSVNLGLDLLARRRRRVDAPCGLRLERVKIEGLDLLDTYRLMNGVAVDLRPASDQARLFLFDLALRLAQGQGYAELLARVLRPDSPIYDGQSPLSPTSQDLPALKAARDLVFRAGVAEGLIQSDSTMAPLPAGLRSPSTARARSSEASGLTTEAIVTVGEAMDMLGITRQAVINAVRTGRIRGEQHGKLWVLSREDVLRYQLARDDRRLAREAL